MNISYEQFEKYMNTLKEKDEKDTALTNALGVEGIITYTIDLSTSLVELLEIVTNDTEEMIQHFIYELDFGSEDDCMWDSYDKVIPMATIKDLYDYLSGVK